MVIQRWLVWKSSKHLLLSIQLTIEATVQAEYIFLPYEARIKISDRIHIGWPQPLIDVQGIPH